MVHIGGWKEAPNLNASINDIKVWKFNKTTTLEAPYIVRKGDVVEIDTADASIKVNGKDAIYTKDLFGDFINIEKERIKSKFFLLISDKWKWHTGEISMSNNDLHIFDFKKNKSLQ